MVDEMWRNSGLLEAGAGVGVVVTVETARRARNSILGRSAAVLGATAPSRGLVIPPCCRTILGRARNMVVSVFVVNRLERESEKLQTFVGTSLLPSIDGGWCQDRKMTLRSKVLA